MAQNGTPDAVLKSSYFQDMFPPHNGTTEVYVPAVKEEDTPKLNEPLEHGDSQVKQRLSQFKQPFYRYSSEEGANSFFDAFLYAASTQYSLYKPDERKAIAANFREKIGSVIADVKNSIPELIRNAFEKDTRSLVDVFTNKGSLTVGHAFLIAWTFHVNFVVFKPNGDKLSIMCETSYQSPRCQVVFMIYHEKTQRFEPIIHVGEGILPRESTAFAWTDEMLCEFKELTEGVCKKNDVPFDQTWYLPKCEGAAVAGNAGAGAANNWNNTLSENSGSPRSTSNLENNGNSGSGAASSGAPTLRPILGRQNSASTVGSLPIDIGEVGEGSPVANEEGGEEGNDAEGLTEEEEGKLVAFAQPNSGKKTLHPTDPEFLVKLRDALLRDALKKDKNAAEMQKKYILSMIEKYLASLPKKTVAAQVKALENSGPEKAEEVLLLENKKPSAGNAGSAGSGAADPAVAAEVHETVLNLAKKLEQSAAAARERSAAKPELRTSTTVNASGREIHRGQVAPGRASFAGVAGSKPLRGGSTRKNRKNRRGTR